LEGHGRRFRAEQPRWEQDSHRARKALGVLTQIIEIHSPAIAAHARDVASLARRAGSFMGLTGGALAELELAANFHDVGKTAVPDRVLLKPGPLDGSEWRLMTCHAEWGAELLMHLPDCATIASVIRHHHERWDGSGYPDGLVGGEIPRASRLIGVCDAYAAMVANRPYRDALRPIAARETLARASGSHFDPDAVSGLLGALSQGRVRLLPRRR
jgi:HD-GYP domain-containing protein (c-di-GMP phosphodiesterase class II)